MDGPNRNQEFESIALPHLDAAYNLARWLARDDAFAEDVVQVAMLRAFRFFDGFRGGDARAWLLAIVRNTYLTELRDSRHAREEVPYDESLHDGEAHDLTVYSPGADPAAIVASMDTRRSVHAALEKLPLAFREVIVLKEMDDLSYSQIAQVLGIPIGTVMSRLARARKLLAEQFARQGE